jgi:alpha-L-rhamnosidase
MKKRLLLIAFAFVMMNAKVSAVSFSLYDLTCEQEENPIGIDAIIPHFSWKINSIERNFKQSAYQIIVSSSRNILNEGKGNIWDSGKIKSSQSILVPFAGKKLLSLNSYFWKIRSWNQKGEISDWSNSASFSMGILSSNDWGGAQWIAFEKDSPKDRIVPGISDIKKLPDLIRNKTNTYLNPQFRKEFTINQPIRKAIISISGLGQFDLFLNGKKVGNHFLDPGWTNYDKSALYVSFDVTDMLKNGKNVIGTILGGGFYHTAHERYLKLYTAFGAPKLKMNLRIEYEDGSISRIISDKTWKVTRSPITFSSIYGGEDYDATCIQDGWMLPGFNDTKWNHVVVSNYNIPLFSQRYDPITVRQILPPVRVFKNGKGNWIYDLGQNSSGIFRINITGKRGDSIIVRPAELLDNNNNVDQRSSGGPIWFSYKISGKGKETWHPQFTYYGFRYLQVEGAVPSGQNNPDSLPELNELVGLHTSNSAQEVGQFSCSKPLFNHTHELIDWAMRSNMVSILTDCPHREKLGWLEQDYLMQYSLLYRYNLARLYKKIVSDMQQAQTEKGIIPSICPEYVHFKYGFEDSPEWGSAFIISPYYYYLWYGDKELLETYYNCMQKYINYLGTRADNHIISYGLGDWYDLGDKAPGYSQLTSNGVTATGIYFYDVTIMQKIANLLGKNKDADSYAKLAEEIKLAFNNKYFHKASYSYDRNSQTANAIPLYFGIVEPQYKRYVLQNLVNDIRKRGNALTAGDIGYRFVLQTLEENNLQNIIYEMNSKYDTPGYGYQLAHGATSLTESWNALKTSSNNHFMLGHIMEWLYSGLGGIRQQDNSCAFNKILIDPQILGDITYAHTSYESPYGNILCEWKIDGDMYSLKISIPANCEAIIYLLVNDINNVTEYGQPIEKRSSLKIIGKENGIIKVNAGSGEYLFKMKIDKKSIMNRGM